jgi:DNA-binding NarL/FixJ family response regulator
VDTARAQDCLSLTWRLQAALGAAYRAQRRGAEAQQQFSSARVIVERLAADVSDERLRQEFLRGATARLPAQYRLSPRRSAAARDGGLSPREREVAALVAPGRSNREIADELVLGERTVETHVSSILARLGATSRREIATWVAEVGLAAGDA